MEKLLIIDDNEEIRKQLKWGFAKEFEIVTAKNSKEGIVLYTRYRPRVILLDLGLPPHEDSAEEGLRCLHEILKIEPITKIIIITGNNDRGNALKAVQMGAYDFYQKPMDIEELRVTVKRAFHLSNLETENRRLHLELERKGTELYGMVGHCPAMLDIFSTIRKVASSDVAVLVMGESGTGKEMVARAIHSLSLRKDYPFVPINCSAIPENLLESELFGHEKGSFTGAHAQVQGRFEFADRGTLFLDEIGELSPALQSKLLRFLQEKIIQRVGGREDIAVNARVIAATNVDIKKSIQEGKFREDLYYRISVITLHLPPLRERKGDITLLAHLFLRRYAEQCKKKVKGFSPASIELLESYEWFGNVRELENKIQRAVVMSESSLIEAHDLGFTEGIEKPVLNGMKEISLKEAREKIEKEMVADVLQKHGGNILKAAEVLKISRPTLYDLLKKHGIMHRMQ